MRGAATPAGVAAAAVAGAARAAVTAIAGRLGTGVVEAAEGVAAEAQAWEERAGYVDDLVEIVEDMRRGVKDMDDLHAHVDNMPESYHTPKNSAPRV